jgi:hypothetical protein
MSALPSDGLRRGETVVNTFIKWPALAITEVLAGAGFDVRIADLDHSALGLRLTRPPRRFWLRTRGLGCSPPTPVDPPRGVRTVPRRPWSARTSRCS